MSKIKIGFVGVGGMGQMAHLKNYAVLPDCEVAALAELRPGLGKAVATKYNIPKVYTTGEEMTANEKLDGLVASQPFNRHGIVVSSILKAGVPIFTEKPLAASVQVGEKLVKAVKESGTWMMIGYHKRSDPATMYAKAKMDELIATEELGKLRYIRILMPAGDWVANGFAELIGSSEHIEGMEFDPKPDDMDDMTFDRYNAFVNYYIHQVNLLRHLLGEDYHVTHADPAGVVLVAKSDSGLPGVIEMSPYQTTVDWQESALIAFEKGYIQLTLPAPLASNRAGQVEIYKDPGGVTPERIIPQMPWVHAMRQQAINFLSAVKGEAAPMCNAEDALKDLKVAKEYIDLMKQYD